MLINQLVLQLNKAVGILSVFILLAIGGSSFAQVINLPFNDETSVQLLVRKVQIIDSEKYHDIFAEKQKYFLRIDFGRKQFDVAVYNAETKEHITTSFTLMGQSNFEKVTAKKNEEMYMMSKNGVDYTVTFREVIPSFRINQRTIMLFVLVRDSANKKYLYMANDVMYL